MITRDTPEPFDEDAGDHNEDFAPATDGLLEVACLHQDLSGNPAHVPGCSLAVPSTNDAPEVALAKAMEEQGVESSYIPPDFPEDAAAILAAMPGWVLMPRVATADWTGSTKRERLAGILDHAALGGVLNEVGVISDGFIDRVAAALPADAVPDTERPREIVEKARLVVEPDDGWGLGV